MSQEFEALLQQIRPQLHRYCARMTGSSIDGEDVLQETLTKALRAHADGVAIENLEAWLFRIAHNTSLDFLRARSRSKTVPLEGDIEAPAPPDEDIVSVGFQTFLRLPELQRCAVILKDVLGHSIEDIAAIAECTPAAAKSALQRGRATLQKLTLEPEDVRLPMMSDDERRKMTAYVQCFRNGDFDAIRAMLADDVRLELVNRLKLEGRIKVDTYFTRYAAEDKWRFAFGAVEGRPALLVFDAGGTMEKPAHFALVDWQGDRITEIRDFLFAGYALESLDWARLN